MRLTVSGLLLVALINTAGGQEDKTMSDNAKITIEEARLKLAREYNNQVWTLLENEDRTAADDEIMLHAAHASCFLWMQVGTPLNHQRGEWLVARVYAVLGHGDAALRHARRCLELTERHHQLMSDFDMAYAYEGLARALAISGKLNEARKYYRLAEQAGQALKDPEDMKIFMGNLRSEPWGGLR